MFDDVAMTRPVLDDDTAGDTGPWSLFRAVPVAAVETTVVPAVPDEKRIKPPVRRPVDVPAGGQVRRRKETRYEATANLLWIQWCEGEGYLGRSARLVNVSRNGAMIVAGVLLAEGQPVRIFLEQAEVPIGIDATVLGVVQGLHETHQIRLAFPKPCPDDFIRAAARGFESWLEEGRTRVSYVSRGSNDGESR